MNLHLNESARIVENPRNWKEMDGNTDLEKQLNSYLTMVFGYLAFAPSDCCLKEAREIIALFEGYRIK